MKLLVLAALAGCYDATKAPQPLIPAANERSHGPVARDVVEQSVAYDHIGAPGTGAADLVNLQLGVGPTTFSGQYADVLGALNNYGFEVGTSIITSHEGTSGGPFVFGLHRYVPSPPRAVSPLVHLHVGVDVMVATPWVAKSEAMPPQAVREALGVDSEFDAIGWSVRPGATYLRLDFLACRALYVEVGAGPEVFVPDDGPTEYDVRYHGAAGASLACASRGDSFWHHTALLAEYRGRIRVHAAEQAVGYHDALSAVVQFDLPTSWFDGVLQLHFTGEPGAMHEYPMVGVRLQLGFWKRDRF